MTPETLLLISIAINTVLVIIGYFVKRKMDKIEAMEKQLNEIETRMQLAEKDIISIRELLYTVTEMSSSIHKMEIDITEIKGNVSHLTDNHNNQQKQLEKIKDGRRTDD